VLEPLGGYLLLAEKLWADGAAFAEAWNFGPAREDSRPVAEIVEHLARHWGEDAKWEIDAAGHPHEAGLLAVDATKARDRLRWAPRLTLDQALEWSVDWYRNQQHGASAARLITDQITQYQAITI
jgi:CDP-glucose 4,6-dehydratase